MNIWTKKRQQAAEKCMTGIAGALLCMVLLGCGDDGREVLIPVGEPLTGTSEDGTGPGTGPEQAVNAAQAESGARQEDAVIYVHVCGAVRTPGVVLLPEGSRGQEALEAAGGFSPDAAEDAVNLAQPLTDGMQLYFPTREEADVMRESRQAAESGLININTASAKLLCTLPGIGEARAEAIVAYREENGDFQRIEDIMRVSGIKDNAFEKIKDLIAVK